MSERRPALPSPPARRARPAPFATYSEARPGRPSPAATYFEAKAAARPPLAALTLAPSAALALALASSAALAQPPPEGLGAEAVLARGAEALGRGAPREALELYEAYADGGGLHPDVSYSRGVAYLARARAGDDKPGDLGRAAAAFEEALAQRPDDPDAPRALDAVRSAVAHRRARGGKAIEIDAGPGAWAALVGLAGEQTWALLAAAGSLSLSAGLAAWLRARARQARLGGALASTLGALALALGVAFALSARQARTRGERGVVIVPDLRLTTEAGLPLPGSPSLPEAAGVDVAERRGALVRVRWGKVEGWAPATSVKRLPRGADGALAGRRRPPVARAVFAGEDRVRRAALRPTRLAPQRKGRAFAPLAASPARRQRKKRRLPGRAAPTGARLTRPAPD